MQPPYQAQQPYQAQVPYTTPVSPVTRVSQIDYLLGSFVIVMPLALAIAFLANRKRRTVELQRQMALLEKLWKIDTHERSS